MNIKTSLPLLLALCATVAVLVGCGSAQDSQEAESVAAPQPQPVATAVESAPQAQTDVAPTVESAPQAQTVDVGYEVGMRAPEFGMSLLDGSKVTTSDLADEGKPVFLYFHATF